MHLPASTKSTIYVFAGLSLIMGMGAVITFTVFLYTGSFAIFDLPFDGTQVLVFDACLCIAFFLQHTGMIRIQAKKKILPKRSFKAIFSIVSGTILLMLVVLWQESPFLIASADGLLRGFMRAVFFVDVVGLIWATASLISMDMFGVQALMARPGPMTNAPVAMSVTTAGAYGWVRHPVYSMTLVLIWAYPDLTADRLLLNVLFTAWIIAGTVWEERDLVEIFGEDYRIYQRTVPMLIPYRRPDRSGAKGISGSASGGTQE
uniref:Protein-S-isoprenylcysteine O-methyltransferase Ste14 n=1 Tax=Candidatus Kentrum sp. FW TaxID=2126338 RepID=A0A450TC98_9GAMM|nr:MAG: Protein-S-isoprenylcysteine O-methyltransferase Ste14 [Candidatus Kentron sp. FW]